MSDELREKIVELYNKFSTKYPSEVVEVFKREFTEENVDFQLKTPSEDAFIDAFMEIFNLYDVDGEGVILCSEDFADDNGYDFLYSLDEIEDSGEYTSLDDIFDTIEESDLFSAMEEFIKNSVILVRFPEVKVTNERGQFTHIKNLFAKVFVRSDGKLGSENFKLNRSHYTYAHFIHGYMHSHVSSIPTGNFTEFQSCCTGSGPINNTMSILRTMPYDETQWMQFCWDLSKYVTVESEEGVPYHHLNRCNTPYLKGCEIPTKDLGVHINTFRSYFGFNNCGFPNYFWRGFVKYLIENQIPKFRWANKQWEIAEYPTDYIKTISNAFLTYCQENIQSLLESGVDVGRMLEKRVLRKVLIDVNGIFVYEGNGSALSLRNYRDKPVVTFKDRVYTVEIEDRPSNEVPPTQVILDIKAIAFITGCFLKVLNTEYGKRSEDSPSEPEIQFEDF